MEEKKYKSPRGQYALSAAIVIAAAMLSITWLIKNPAENQALTAALKQQAPAGEASMLEPGHILPVEAEQKMLKELVDLGVIDPGKLSQVSELNLLWAFGLANSNPILDNGPINDKTYGGPANMAAVGGWTVSSGSVMDHYSKHKLAPLSAAQQKLVEKIAKGIYRPCCGNSAYFPDCNHGMAMVGLLEYLAANNATESELWNAAAVANTLWFPDHYKIIGSYLKQKGVDLKTIKAQDILGAAYSSAQGFANVSSQVSGGRSQSGADCGVGTQQPAAPVRASGCGI